MNDPDKENTMAAKLLESNGFLIASLGAESRRRFMQVVSQWEIGWSDQNVLAALLDLSSSVPVTQKQVADFVDIDPRNLVSVIDNLEKRDLVKRMPNPEDRRSYHLALTKTGTALAHKLRAEGVKLEGDMFDCLTPSEKTALHKLLLKLYRAIETNGW